MKLTGRCPKCGSNDIIRDAMAVDRGHSNRHHEMLVATIGDPGAVLFKDKHYTYVSAWVCANCGLVEYYADNPADLKSPKVIHPRVP
jgi:predicted nucleic-acid-binding Zn-ribbon protein